MKTEKEILKLLETIKKVKMEMISSRWFCVDCNKPAEETCFREEHTLILDNDVEHEGLLEWYRCLKWVLGEKVPKYNERREL